MGLDQFLRPEGAIKRKSTAQMMTENYERLIPHLNEASMPFWIVPKI